jgi:hypothetical protein
MKLFALRCLVATCVLSLLQLPLAQASVDAPVIHVFVNNSCIVADEPYFVPEVLSKDGSEQMTPKFLPLLGIVIGKLIDMFINSEIQSGANAIKAKGARKDTRYAVTRQMNLYRADLEVAPTLNINSKLGCMTIVAANLKPAPATCQTDYIPKTLAPESMEAPEEQWKTSRVDNSVENRLRRANICVDGKAAAVYEGRFEFSEDGTAYRLKDAGYSINSLLTTQDKGATRSTMYTLRVTQPGATDQQEALSSAWVNLGVVAAGAESKGSGGDSAPWLRVPPLSAEARRVYDEKTRAHQEVTGQIEALKRAMTRNQRILNGLDQRTQDATGDVAAGLKQEHTRVAVELQTQSAELDALNEEYRDLPHDPLEFMPVTIEVAVTETESEKKLQLALADIIGNNSDLVASNVSGVATSALSKSLNLSDLKLGTDAPPPQSPLGLAKARYFDAVVAARNAPPGGEMVAAQGNLRKARREYNAARQAAGMEPLP